MADYLNDRLTEYDGLTEDLKGILEEHPVYASGITDWKIKNEIFGGDDKHLPYIETGDVAPAKVTSYNEYKAREASKSKSSSSSLKPYIQPAKAVVAGLGVVAGAVFGSYALHLAQESIHKVTPQIKISSAPNSCDGVTGAVDSVVYDGARHLTNMLVDNKLCTVYDGVEVKDHNSKDNANVSAQEVFEQLRWYGDSIPTEVILHDSNHDGRLDILEISGPAQGYKHTDLNQKHITPSNVSQECGVAPRAPGFSGASNPLDDHALVSYLVEKANQTGCNQIEVDAPVNLDDLVWMANEVSEYNMNMVVKLDHPWEHNYTGFDVQNATDYKNQTLRRAKRIVSAIGDGNQVTFNLGSYKENDPGFVDFVNNELLPMLKSLDAGNQYEITVSPEHLSQADVNFDPAIMFKTNYTAGDMFNDTVSNLSEGRGVTLDVSTSAYDAQKNSVELNNQSTNLEEKINDIQERNNSRLKGISLKMTDDYWKVGGPQDTIYGDSNHDPVIAEYLGILDWTNNGDGTILADRPVADTVAGLLNYIANQTANQTNPNGTNETNGTGNNNTNPNGTNETNGTGNNNTNPNGTNNGTNTSATGNATTSRPERKNLLDYLEKHWVSETVVGGGLVALLSLVYARRKHSQTQSHKAEGALNEAAKKQIRKVMEKNKK